MKFNDSKIIKKFDRNNMPSHISLIMDGNGRWAKRRGENRTAGHRQGMKTLKEVLRTSAELGIKYLTVYAFSTENWKRPKDEVDTLMDLLVEYLSIELEELISEGVKIQIIGNKSNIPKHVLRAMENAEHRTAQNSRIFFNIAFNYGAREEMVEAVKRIVEEGIESSEINEDLLKNYLYTKTMPDPDLLIRTGGDYRISNFMLYQCAYTELYFTNKKLMWPNFTKGDYFKAILEYQKRQRRYGGV